MSLANKRKKSHISRIEPDIWKHVEELLKCSDLRKWLGGGGEKEKVLLLPGNK